MWFSLEPTYELIDFFLDVNFEKCFFQSFLLRGEIKSSPESIKSLDILVALRNFSKYAYFEKSISKHSEC